MYQKIKEPCSEVDDELPRNCIENIFFEKNWKMHPIKNSRHQFMIQYSEIDTNEIKPLK